MIHLGLPFKYNQNTKHYEIFWTCLHFLCFRIKFKNNTSCATNRCASLVNFRLAVLFFNLILIIYWFIFILPQNWLFLSFSGHFFLPWWSYIEPWERLCFCIIGGILNLWIMVLLCFKNIITGFICVFQQVYGSRSTWRFNKHEAFWVFQEGRHLCHGARLLGNCQQMFYWRYY